VLLAHQEHAHSGRALADRPFAADCCASFSEMRRNFRHLLDHLAGGSHHDLICDRIRAFLERTDSTYLGSSGASRRRRRHG